MVVRKKPQASKPDKAKKDLKEYARYSSLAFRLIAIVLLGFFAGMKLDQWLETKFSIFTLVLASAGLFLSLYLLIKDLLK
jgi:F0F1-type ATP synthase assembly protein I